MYYLLIWVGYFYSNKVRLANKHELFKQYIHTTFIGNIEVGTCVFI